MFNPLKLTCNISIIEAGNLNMINRINDIKNIINDNSGQNIIDKNVKDRV